MTKPKLFEYAVLYHPKPVKNGAGEEERKPSELLVEPARALCTAEQEAVILAARKIPEAYLDKLDCVEVLVRPF